MENNNFQVMLDIFRRKIYIIFQKLPEVGVPPQKQKKNFDQGAVEPVSSDP